MSVQKVFWQDPYRTECDVQIITVNGNVVTVDQTIFYAFSGGQESDAGWIGSHRVLEARKDGCEIHAGTRLQARRPSDHANRLGSPLSPDAPAFRR